MGILMRLRNEGIAAEIYPENAKLKKQFQYAEKKSIPFLIIIGSEEIKSGKFSLKNLGSGEQKLIGEEELIREMKQNL